MEAAAAVGRMSLTDQVGPLALVVRVAVALGLLVHRQPHRALRIRAVVVAVRQVLVMGILLLLVVRES